MHEFMEAKYCGKLGLRALLGANYRVDVLRIESGQENQVQWVL